MKRSRTACWRRGSFRCRISDHALVDIMELLRRELPKYGGSFIQCEDEIASISMAIGASYGDGSPSLDPPAGYLS